MRLKIFALLLLMTFTTVLPMHAGLEVPGEADPILAEVTFEVADVAFKAQKIYEPSGIYVLIKNATDNSPVFKSEVIGDQEKLFIINKSAVSMYASDVTGDGQTELIVAAWFPPDNGALYVFRYNRKSNSFSPMPFRYATEDLSRDFMVADIIQDSGEDLVISENNTFRALGWIYPEEPDGSKTEAFYYFRSADNEFRFVRREAVPEG